jgi:hypothetical protein
MAVYKRGGTWWYDFEFKGTRHQASTKVSNKRVAESIEAAKKTQLVKGEVGIQDRTPAPTLKEFAPRFEKTVEMQCAEKPATVEFYKAKLKTLLADEALATRRIDLIDESVIEEYVQARGKATVSPEEGACPGFDKQGIGDPSATAAVTHEWREISRLPRIRLLRGERNRESVLSPTQEPAYLAISPDPLADVAVLLLDTGLRLGEALSLEWPQLRLEAAIAPNTGI